MSNKPLIMLGMLVGSFAGGYAVTLFGASSFSLTAIIGSTVGAIVGVYAVWKWCE